MEWWERLAADFRLSSLWLELAVLAGSVALA